MYFIHIQCVYIDIYTHTRTHIQKAVAHIHQDHMLVKTAQTWKLIVAVRSLYTVVNRKVCTSFLFFFPFTNDVCCTISIQQKKISLKPNPAMKFKSMMTVHKLLSPVVHNRIAATYQDIKLRRTDIPTTISLPVLQVIT